jgi:hypothetical protein
MLYLPSCICSAWAGAKSEIANNNERSVSEMAKKKASKNIPIPILIIICAVLLYAIYTSVSTLALAIWGDSVMGTVDSYDIQLDDTEAEPNRSRTVSKGYWFIANGKEYRGYVMYSSDEAWPSLDEGETRSERIRYLTCLPYVNKPAMLSEFERDGRRGNYLPSFFPHRLSAFAAACHTHSQRREKEETGGEEARRASNNQAEE